VYSSGIRSLLRGRASPPIVAIVLVAVALAGIVPAATFLHGSGPGASTPISSSSTPPAVVPRPAVHPTSSQNVSGSFYGTNSSFANLPSSSDACGANFENYSYGTLNYTDNYTYLNCFGGAQNPSLLNLADGNLGVGYSVFTPNDTACLGYASDVVSRIGFQVSTDSGATFGPAQYLGNQTCTYLQAIEPSFAVSSSGTVYGTFVEENATTHNNSLGASFPMDYWNRTADALGFTWSTDNGTTFSPVTTLSAAGLANVARPQIAAFGQSVYVVYDHFNNWTNLTLPSANFTSYPPTHPIAVDLIYSNDGGVTWNGPYTLPGLNGSAGYTSFSPAISVSSTGKLAVAYATDRACFEGYLYYCDDYGESAVVATSATNGSTWSAPAVLGFVGETHRMGYNNETSPNYWYYGYAYQFQTAPELAVAWSDTSASTVYAAWAGEYSYRGLFFTSYGYSGVFSAVSTNGGSTWANGTAAVPTYGLFGTDEYNFDPALVVHSGTVYLAYSNENESYCSSSTPGCSPFAEHFSYWMVNSTNGTGWSSPTYLAGDPTYYSETQNAWVGYNDAVTYTSDGPVASFSQPEFAVYSYGFATFNYANGSVAYEYWTNTTGQSDLTVALPWTGATVAVNLSEDGLPAGTYWTVNFTGYSYTVNVSTVTITNVPVGQTMYYQETSSPPAGFWARYAVLYGASGIMPFTSPGNITFYFSLEYGLTLYVNPAAVPYLDFYGYFGSTYFYWDHYGTGQNYYSEPFPWYIPAGTFISFDQYDLYSAPLAAPIAFTGFGSGSSTVVASSTYIIMNGPINETIWYGALGSYPVTFVPAGLPASSSYSFNFGGTVYSANGTEDVTVTNVSTGAYGLSNISANSSTPGWAYFGQASSGTTVVVPNVIEVDLNFSAIHVGVPAGPVSFQASGLAPGDFWTLAFNGSQYGSSTPWINVTAHPGNYTVGASPVPASANDTTAYSPVGFGPILSITPSSTYPVNFTPTYRVQVIAGAGGTTTGAGSHWLAPGSVATYSATARPNYAFLGWTGTGAGSYTGSNATADITANSPITESANFQALPVNRFNLTVVASGLPSGTWWTVDVNGTGYSSDQPSQVVRNLLPCSAGPTAQYPIGVPEAFVNGSGGVRFLAGGYPSSDCTSGTTVLNIAFATEYLVTPLASGGGSADAVVSGTPVPNPVWVAGGSTIGLRQSPHANDQFVAWLGTGTGAYSGPNPTPSVVVGAPITETATFAPIIVAPPVTYELSVQSTTTLAAGTEWSIAVNGASYSATGTWVNVSGLAPGSYTVTFHTTLSLDRQTQYTPSTIQTSVTLSGNQTIQVAFETAYWVSESASPGGSLVGGFNGFEAAGHSLSLDASPATGYVFVSWAGTGSGAYSGANASVSIIVNSPIAEVASFAPTPPSSSSGSVGLGSPVVLVALAVVGLVAGLALGYVLTRGKRGDSGGSS
jgi:List-Bact-rpt repeat protein